MEREGAVIDEPLLALGAADRHLPACRDLPGRVARSDDRGDPELPADDRGVGGPPAPVRHDGGGRLHHRLPVRRGGVGDEDLPRLELGETADIGDDPGLPGGDRVADALSDSKHRPAFVQVVGLEDISCLLRLHRLRPGLDDEEFSGFAVLCPLDIHRHRLAGLRRVVVLDRERISGKRQDIVVGDAEPLPVDLRDIDSPGDLFRPAVTVDQFHPLLAEVLPDDSTIALPERRFEDIELIGVDSALNDHLAKPVGPGDEDDVPEAGVGVECEDDPACGEVGADHLHDPDREGDLEVVKVVVYPVSDRPVGEEGGKAPDVGLPQRLVAPDVQVGLLLARKRGCREVFGGC